MARRAQKKTEEPDSLPQADAAPESGITTEPADPFSGVDIPEPGTGIPDDVVAVQTQTASKPGQAREGGPGRGWTERFGQPVAYRRFTLKDEHGAEKILFTFSLPPGQTKPADEVIDVMRDHKFWKNGQAYGLADDARSNGESYETGLKFGTNAKFPKAWVLPNNALGRDVADSIDRGLQDVARKMEGAAALATG